MIEVTEADIGRRVIYDARPTIKHLGHGQIVGVDQRAVWVLFDGTDGPLNVISNLKWADETAKADGAR